MQDKLVGFMASGYCINHIEQIIIKTICRHPYKGFIKLHVHNSLKQLSK